MNYVQYVSIYIHTHEYLLFLLQFNFIKELFQPLSLPRFFLSLYTNNDHMILCKQFNMSMCYHSLLCLYINSFSFPFPFSFSPLFLSSPPPTGVPEQASPMLEFHEAVSINHTEGPLLVHCRYRCCTHTHTYIHILCVHVCG